MPPKTIDHEIEVDVQNRPFELIPVSDLLRPQQVVDFLIEGLIETGVSVGLVAPPEHGKSLLAQHWAACVGSGRDYHGRRVKHGLAVYLFGEGQHGAARRFQALNHRYGLELDKAALVVSRCATQLIDPLEVARVRAAIAAAEDRFGLPLSLLVVDTVARFLAPADESKASDMGAFMAAVDTIRGDASAVSCHHPGHGDATRGRGSSSWKAALDAEYTIASAGDVFTLTCQKLKDGERPAPLSFRVEPVPTMCAKEDGSPISSVVLVPAEATNTRALPTGKNQKILLAELERLGGSDHPGIWSEGELRELGRGLGMHKNSARDAVLGLRQLGYLETSMGGTRLTDFTHGPKDRKGTESTISSRGIGDETTGGSIRPPVSVQPSSHPEDQDRL